MNEEEINNNCVGETTLSDYNSKMILPENYHLSKTAARLSYGVCEQDSSEVDEFKVFDVINNEEEGADREESDASSEYFVEDDHGLDKKYIVENHSQKSNNYLAKNIGQIVD